MFILVLIGFTWFYGNSLLLPKVDIIFKVSLVDFFMPTIKLFQIKLIKENSNENYSDLLDRKPNIEI